MANYQGAMAQLEDLGVLDVLLPFLLIFVLIFAVLQKSKVLGADSRKYNIVVALVMALGVVFPHVLGYYPADRDIVDIINKSLPNVSVVIVAIVMGLVIIGLLGKRFQLGNKSLSSWIALGAFGLIVYIFGDAANWWQSPTWLSFLGNSDTVTLVVAILIFAIIIWFITSDSGDAVSRAKKRFGGEDKPEYQRWKAAYDAHRMQEQFREMMVNPQTGQPDTKR